MTALPGPDPVGLDIIELADALASMPPDTVLSHRSTALTWGLWIPRYDGIEVSSPAVEEGSRRTTSVQRRTITSHRQILGEDDIGRANGLPVTSLARTWLDLAALLEIHDLVAAGDRALQLGATLGELRAIITRGRTRRGVVRARAAVELLNPRSRSRPESRIRSALVLGGLPEPRVNEAVRDRHGGWLAEPDLHYREAKLALEYNGADHAEPVRMQKDSVRLLDVQREGWTVRTYTSPHAYQRLHEVVIDVTSILRRKAPELLAEAALSRRVTYFQDQRRRIRRL